MPWTIGGRSRGERKVEKGSANLKGAGAGRISAKECPGGFPGWYIVLFLYLNHSYVIRIESYLYLYLCRALHTYGKFLE